MSTKKQSGPGQARKAELELEDLDLVFRVLFQDSSDGLKHLDLTSRRVGSHVPAGSLKEIVRGMDVCLEAGAPFFVGGGGIIVRCVNPKVPEVRYALKIPRPSLFDNPTLSGREKHRAELDEYLKHAPLLHENVARVLQTGAITVPDRDGTRIEH